MVYKTQTVNGAIVPAIPKNMPWHFNCVYVQFAMFHPTWQLYLANLGDIPRESRLEIRQTVTMEIAIQLSFIKN